jgi:DNA gyrase subunit A
VVAARLVSDDDEIMLITTGGVLIRTRVREIRELGRATQGVTLIALDAGEKLAGLEKVVESEEDVAAVELDESRESTDSSELDESSSEPAEKDPSAEPEPDPAADPEQE